MNLYILQKKSYLLFCCEKEKYIDNNKIIELKQLLDENNIQFIKIATYR